MQDKQRVLIVDDTPANIRSLNNILYNDYNISVATNGEEAIKLANADLQPDIILLDILMPGMDGYQVLEQLKSEDKTKDIPVIFVTILSEDEEEARGLDLGAVDYLAKPMSPAIVLARVKTHLALKERNQLLKDYARLRDEVERMTHHDLASPLLAIINVPDLMLKDDNLTPHQIKLLNMLQKAGHNMLEIVNRSIDLYKMEIGQYKLTPVPVSLTEVFDQIINDLDNLIKTKQISLNFTISGELAKNYPEFILSGDKILYYSMFSNLVRNALEASPPGEQVAIELIAGNIPSIMISNQGEVPHDIRDNFFGKFVTSNKVRGTGLGTYIAKLVSDMLGGALVMNSSTGQGTVITYSPPPNGIITKDSTAINNDQF